jgi:hypothetical protein
LTAGLGGFLKKDMNMDITTRLREVPTMRHDAGCVEEAAKEIEKLRGCLFACKIAMESSEGYTDWSRMVEHINDVLTPNVKLTGSL